MYARPAITALGVERGGAPGRLGSSKRRLRLTSGVGVVVAASVLLQLIIGSARAATSIQATRLGATARAAAALASGRYEEARRFAGGTKASDPGLTLIAARAEVALGLLDPVRQRLEAAVERWPQDLPLRRALCEVLAHRGDQGALKPLIDLTYEDWRTRRAEIKSAADLLSVAAIVRLDGNWQDANDTLRAAVRAAPLSPEANVFWGYLFLDKHAVAEAERSFRTAVTVAPHDADAHVGMATVHLRRSYDVAAAEAELAAALRSNPRHAGALAVRTEMAIDGEDFDAASELVNEIRRTNPRDRAAAWLAAARARLLDDVPAYERERDGHAAVHPADGDFFAEVADLLIRHRRTDDARDLAEECVRVDPRNAHCQSILGTTLLRLGEDEAGVEALRRAWKRDPYDARTYNLLELYEKVVPRMQTFSTKHFSFRIDPGTRVAIERVVAPYLEETYARYQAKYGFQPRGPIRFELYSDPDHFAIRTVGLPGIGVEAVCFGRVITSQAPTNGAMNWGMVLAHELAHVFAIELSRSRVPRWFTEGLSELETMRARPEWTRHAERNLWGAAHRDELAPLSLLSNAFIRARGAEEGTRAYAEAAMALDYLDRRFGFARIRDALVGFGTGARGLGVIAAAMGVSVEELERGFRADLLARSTAFEQQYLPSETLRPPRDAFVPPAEEASTARPATKARSKVAANVLGSDADRADRFVRMGLLYLRAGDAASASRALDSARAVSGGTSRRGTLFLSGELALAQRRADEARQVFLRLLALPAGADGENGGDGYDVRVRLALAEIHRGDLPAAEEHLKRAITFDPGSAEATGLMVELLGDPAWHGTREEDRLKAIAATLRLEPLHAKLARELVFGLARHGRVSEVIAAAPLAIFIDPGLWSLHAAYGRALATSGKSAAAAAALQNALALGPPAEDQLPLRKLLATLSLTLGDSRSAAPGARQ